jgi:hypothetical protein
MRYRFIAIFLKTKKPEATISLVEGHFSVIKGKQLPGAAR